MKKLMGCLILFWSLGASAAVERSGDVKSVQIWGSIAKAKICASENACTYFWVDLGDSKGQAVLSMWLAAKLSSTRIYVQGYDPEKPEHPYSNASKIYGMNLN